LAGRCIGGVSIVDGEFRLLRQVPHVGGRLRIGVNCNCGCNYWRRIANSGRHGQEWLFRLGSSRGWHAWQRGTNWAIGVTGSCAAKIRYGFHTEVINDSFHGSWGHTDKNSTEVSPYC
jgi:hypothetical protein